MNCIVPRLCAFVLFCMSASESVLAAAHGWPLMPTNSDHPLGATVGEFRAWGASVSQHTGLDIMADGGGDQYVVVTVGGTIEDMPKPGSEAPQTKGSSVVIRVRHDDAPATVGPSEELRYMYAHLSHASLLAGFVNTYIKGDKVTSGTPVALLDQWTCNYKHLHYDIASTDVVTATVKYLNPLDDIAPNPDSLAPEILSIDLVKHAPTIPDRWGAPFNSNGRTCTVVKGEVDVIVKVLDRDDAGSTLPGATSAGIYSLGWRACPSVTPNCAPWSYTQKFVDMPNKWAMYDDKHTVDQFSTTCPWKSNYNECSTCADTCSISASACSAAVCSKDTAVNETFVVVTSSPSSAWNTALVPDGTYTVGVEARDHAGNATVNTIPVCVQNQPPPVELPRHGPCPPGSLTIDGETISADCGPP